MAKQASQELQQLTADEIARQIRLFSDQRTSISAQLAELFRNRKVGAAPPEPALIERDKAVRRRARELLDGRGPVTFLQTPSENEEQVLLVERDAVDMILAVLRKDEIRIQTAAAVEFAGRHRDRWCQMAREILLHTLTILELAERLRTIVRGVDGAARLPADVFLGGAVEVWFKGWPLRELLADARDCGLISESEFASCAD